jgi:hypothetical protein
MAIRSRKPTKVNRRRRQRMWLTIGVILASCCVCTSGVAVVAATGILNTPTPAIEANAFTVEEAISYTQTAAVQIPITGATNTEASVSTKTSPATTTTEPSQTFDPTITNTPIETFTPPPSRTPIPTSTLRPPLPTLDPLAGVTAICNDGTYSYSQNSRGTCSHHGGVKEWINRPPN